jgi:Ca2+-binding RTX toxin-like protein
MKLRVGLILATMLLGGMLLSEVVLAKDIRGGPNADNLPGTNRRDYIKGNGGPDNIDGKKGEDTISGGKDNDRMYGGRGIDWIWGDDGADTAYGNQGNDHLFAEEEHQGPKGLIQAAKIKDVRKPDELLGGRGNDTIRAQNGKRDIIRGGPGRDTAYVDREVDDYEGVEVVIVTPPPNEPPVANDDSYSANENGYLKVDNGPNDLLSNDTDTDNPNNTNAGLTVKDANPNTPEIDPVSGPSTGVLLALKANGSFEYDTDLNNPNPVCFTYKATDGAADSNVATVKINVGNAPCPL